MNQQQMNQQQKNEYCPNAPIDPSWIATLDTETGISANNGPNQKKCCVHGSCFCPIKLEDFLEDIEKKITPLPIYQEHKCDHCNNNVKRVMRLFELEENVCDPCFSLLEKENPKVKQMAFMIMYNKKK